MQTLINGIPYEGRFDYVYNYTNYRLDVLGEWVYTTTKQYTIYYPSNIINKTFDMLLLFVYQANDGNENTQLTPIIATTNGTEDTVINFSKTNTSTSSHGLYPNVPSTIYKAFWI
jgi:hypothetical protein